MRVFIAIPLPSALKKSLKNLQFRSDNIRWQAENFHITLKFVGEISPELVECVKQELGSVHQKAFGVMIKDWGTFPQKGKSKVLWAGVEAADEMMELQTEVEKVCATNGIDEERRPFVPHVTLGKIKGSISRKTLAKYLDAPASQSKKLWIDQFALFKSDLYQDGAKHEIIKKYPLPA